MLLCALPKKKEPCHSKGGYGGHSVGSAHYKVERCVLSTYLLIAALARRFGTRKTLEPEHAGADYRRLLTFFALAMPTPQPQRACLP